MDYTARQVQLIHANTKAVEIQNQLRRLKPIVEGLEHELKTMEDIIAALTPTPEGERDE